MAPSIARQAVSVGDDPARVAAEIVQRLAAPELAIAFVFADWRLEPAVIARVTQRGLSPAPVVGCSTIGVISPYATPADRPAAIGLGLYGGWARVGVGVAPDLSRSALTRGRDAVHHAAAALGTTTSALDSSRHTGIAMVDGSCAHVEAFCIGSAAAAPQIRFIGGCAATEAPGGGATHVWVHGEAMVDAGVVVVLDSELPVHAVTTAHLVPTHVKAVITAANGRVIEELDGRPAGPRLHDLVLGLGEPLDDALPAAYSFARYIDGVPYVRSMTHIDGARIHLASAVEVGHVLHVMRPDDLIGTTRRDLASAVDRAGGALAALLAFSCVGRHWEACARGIAGQLAEVYAAYPIAGLHTAGEQLGMLLVNHTLTGLAISARPDGMTRR